MHVKVEGIARVSDPLPATSYTMDPLLDKPEAREKKKQKETEENERRAKQLTPKTMKGLLQKDEITSYTLTQFRSSYTRAHMYVSTYVYIGEIDRRHISSYTCILEVKIQPEWTILYVPVSNLHAKAVKKRKRKNVRYWDSLSCFISHSRLKVFLRERKNRVYQKMHVKWRRRESPLRSYIRTTVS